MLPKQYRLKKKKDFAKLYRRGISTKGSFLIVRQIGNQLDCSRVGIVVSKNVSKKATIRNKLKRRLREAMRLMILEVKEGFDIVIIALPSAQKKTFEEIRDELKVIFSKAHLLK